MPTTAVWKHVQVPVGKERIPDSYRGCLPSEFAGQVPNDLTVTTTTWTVKDD